MPPAGFDRLGHLVVVMMENRSFDHMLGGLKSRHPDIDGLDGTESNPDTTGATVNVQGTVALDAGDLGFGGLAHSFAAGLTLRAGGFPVMNLSFAWGGHEGHHALAAMDGSLLGGSSRPPLF